MYKDVIPIPLFNDHVVDGPPLSWGRHKCRLKTENDIIRKNLLKHRLNIAPAIAEKAALKINNLFNKNFLPTIAPPNIVGGFVPIKGEISDLPILLSLNTKGIKIAIPYCINRELMEFYEWDCDIKSLVKDHHNILSVRKNSPLKPSHLLVPLLGVTKQGYLLGYGSGYYDRYLANHPNTITIGVCFASQIIEGFEIKPHDIQLNYILCENVLLKCKSKL